MSPPLAEACGAETAHRKGARFGDGSHVTAIETDGDILLRKLAGALAMPEQVPLGNIVRITNHAAAATWVVLASIAAGSGIAWPGVATINFIATPFLLVPALLLFWRARAFGAMSRSTPASEPLLSLLRCEAVTAASILVVGLLFVAAAVSRVWGEGFPLFG